MAYFLAKTEPGTYSIDDLERDGQTEWDGVRNPAAVNAIKSMKKRDRVIIYHSGKDAAVVGLAEVVSEPRPDEKDDRSWVADFKFVRHAKKHITLRDINGWSSAEVCNALGISETNQRVLLHRARSKVRLALAQYLGDE